MRKELPEHYYSMLKDLQAVDFVIIELTLYLDTHPCDAQAIEQIRQFSHNRMELARRFEAEFGPLNPFGQQAGCTNWQWIDTPWPWQV
ncbi:spore coat protein CotJB [Paenibacillus sp. N1-5-1-14]|uniref:spore coat protein CotJB n=1 Tax=Paenibacillus radicibacter TaxID=2972488 RepID=UPI002158C94A|nr:spore coat protein CotJB [Paenibacillus radicibacter]MCR8643685.1 spore coat protein CotJB [Paenibacillus radicibacter]